MELQGLLSREVDVVTESGLKPRIRARVLRKAVTLRETLRNVYGKFCANRTSEGSKRTSIEGEGDPEIVVGLERCG